MKIFQECYSRCFCLALNYMWYSSYLVSNLKTLRVKIRLLPRKALMMMTLKTRICNSVFNFLKLRLFSLIKQYIYIYNTYLNLCRFIRAHVETGQTAKILSPELRRVPNRTWMHRLYIRICRTKMNVTDTNVSFNCLIIPPWVWIIRVYPSPITLGDHSRRALARQGSECNKVQCAQNNRAQRHVCCSCPPALPRRPPSPSHSPHPPRLSLLFTRAGPFNYIRYTYTPTRAFTKEGLLHGLSLIAR